MTREEEVRAAIDKVFPCTDEGRCYEQAIGASGFELGVKWSDEHPKNVWHDASEEPEYRNGGILCEHDLYYWVATQPYLSSICGNWHKKVEREHLKRWAYISDLLPKGGEK